MKCPFCSNVENKVIDSRISKDGNAIRRRRECLACGKRFTTYEFVGEGKLLTEGRSFWESKKRVKNAQSVWML